MAATSKAAEAFVKNFEDVHRLLELHTKEGGSAKGPRHGLEVLNKAAIVLITAFWEAYCEDIAAEGLQHLLDYSESADTFPKLLKKQLAEEIKRAPNDLEVWSLAGNGWKTYLSQRMKELADNRNRKLNTPKADQLDKLFKTALGIDKISDQWSWQGSSVARSKKNLNAFVELRGSIAHRGKSSKSVTRKQVTDYIDFVRRLADINDEAVNQHVNRQTGKPLFDQ